MPVLLLPPALVPPAVGHARQVHRDNTGRDTGRGLRAAGEQLRHDGRAAAAGRCPGIVQPADRAVPVARRPRRQLHVRRPGEDRRQRDGPRRQHDVARGRSEHDGMSRHPVNIINVLSLFSVFTHSLSFK